MLYLKPFENSSMGNDMFCDFFSGNMSDMMPKTDVRETENEYIVESDMPGVKKEDIKINFKDDSLIMEVNTSSELEEKSDGSRYIRRERRSQNFKRMFRVRNIDRENIDASYNDGVLKIVLPKMKKNEIESSITVR